LQIIFLGKKIPWKKFLGNNFPCNDIPWKRRFLEKNSL
jgi:hypothetical protein